MSIRNTIHTLFFLLFIVSTGYAQDWQKEFDSYIGEAKELQEISNYDEAIPLFKSAQKIATDNNDTLRIFEAGIGLADALYDYQKLEESKELLLYLESLGTAETPPGMLAEIKSILGSVYFGLGKYELSNQQYEIGYSLADPHENTYTAARISMNYANGLIRFGEYDHAISLITESIDLFTSINDPYYISRTKLIKYIIYLFQGGGEDAEFYLFEAYKIAQELSDPQLLRDCYLYLSDHFSRKNDYSQSISYSKRGLQLAEQLNNEIYIARYYKELGSLYLAIEEPDRALSYLNRAHSYYQSTNSAALANEILYLISGSYLKKGDFEEAENILLQALSFYRNTNFNYDKGNVLIMLGEINLRANRHDEALKYLQEALKVGRDNELIWLQLNGQQRLLRLDESLYSAEEKLSLSRQLYNYSSKFAFRYYLDGLKNLAVAHSRVESDSSIFYAEKALELIEKKRLTFSGGTLKANVFSYHAPFYNSLGSWYASFQNDYAKAFELFEASKSRALLDQLAESRSQELLSLSEETQFQLLDLQKKIDQLYRKREVSNNTDELLNLSNDITDAEFEYEVALEKIRDDHPGWSRFIYPPTLSLDQAQDFCDDKTAILEYAFLDDGLAAMLVTKNDVFYHQLTPGKSFKEDFTSQINAFRDSIVTSASIEVLKNTSASIYSTLLAPFEDKLSEISNLVIVPDGPIALLPFDALFYNGEFLINRFAVKSLPSVSVFNLIQNPHRKTTLDILGIASSGFETEEGTVNSRTQNSYAAIPYTLIEVDSVSSKFSTRKVLKNDMVTEAGLKTLDLGAYKYLHFATHGEINETTPTQSGLILSKKTEMEALFGEDGYLNAQEITSFSLNADMVVLSACNTGTGKVLNGEGLLGLQRSFLTAGASSVVASLWSIYDRSTPLFMTTFYSKLIDYKEKEFGWFDRLMVWGDWFEPDLVDYKTLALRDAKLEMLSHPYYNHPVHWASFVITGK